MTDRPRKEPSILDEPSVFSKPSPRTFNRNNLPAQDLEQLRAEIARLQARVDDLTEALRPFAQMLERYNLDDHELISICNDFTGQRLNVSHRECWNLARAVLKELENTDDRS